MTTNTYPIPAALAVVVKQDQVLLVRRGNEPDRDRWGFPGGKIHWGEPVLEATLRELMEETGVQAEIVQVLDAVDVIRHGASGSVQHHYVLIAVLCRWQAGEAVAADDAFEARWFTVAELQAGTVATSPRVEEIAQAALDRLNNPPEL